MALTVAASLLILAYVLWQIDKAKTFRHEEDMQDRAHQTQAICDHIADLTKAFSGGE